MRKVGLVFEERDLEPFRMRSSVDLLLLPPGFSLAANVVAATTGIHCLSLSEFVEYGEISTLSTQVAPVIRGLMSRLGSVSVEASSSQNDLYQYHLRLQWLYVVALDRFLSGKSDLEVWTAVQPYGKYNSPMRPELGILYSNARLLGYLASRLCRRKGVAVRTLDERSPFLVYIFDTVRRIARDVFFKLYLAAKLIQKTLRARRRRDALKAKFDASQAGRVGIIVRTDSEVISASYLIQRLEKDSVPYCVIHDEILSSTTTLARLEKMGIHSVSIGCMLGLVGVWRTWCTNAPTLKLDPFVPNTKPCSHAEHVLLRDEEVLNQLKNRLHDFYSIQHNFRLELEQIIERFGIGLLVTYAYVDQWGGVIKAAGDRFGIRTLAVQNAAQDPEEYPKLCWADFYCVESHYLKNRLIRLGYPSNRIAATGLPQFSSVDPQTIAVKTRDASRQRLLILTQPIYQAYFEDLIEVCAEFARSQNVDVAIKYHPRQRGDEYCDVIQKNGAGIQIQVYRQESLDELILSSSAVISIVSAALIRSINLGVPTISFFPLEERHLDLYYANNANLYCVATVDELTVLLKRMKTDEAGFRSDFDERRHHYLREHATFEPTDAPGSNIMLYVSEILAAREMPYLISDSNE